MATERINREAMPIATDPQPEPEQTYTSPPSTVAIAASEVSDTMPNTQAGSEASPPNMIPEQGLARSNSVTSTTTTLCPAPAAPFRPLGHLDAKTRTPCPHHPPHTHPHTCPSQTRTPSPRPPIPVPDVVAVFDPASAGGGGPLVRIATAHSQRSARARSSASSQRPVGMLPAGLSMTAARATQVFVDDKSDEASRKSPAVVEKGVDGGEGTPERKSPEHQPVPPSSDDASDDEKCAPSCCCGGQGCCENCRRCLDPEKCDQGSECGEDPAEHVYPDGGYGWVVVACCTTLCALTNGWGMNYGVFQQVSTRMGAAWLCGQAPVLGEDSQIILVTVAGPCPQGSHHIGLQVA